ncbi:MAG: hypothetical protein H7A21_15915 [Spirochaetales bacterium]|nr:hypothetical protein [Leptospiraceae bacterium]MCP5482924.1 hypothetical protein [Spirochaetales bacterium]
MGSRLARVSKMCSNRVRLALCVFLCASVQCNNNPYGAFPDGRVLFMERPESPSTLDPARVSDIESNLVASNLHDTPFGFHYLRRPLELVPAMARGPAVRSTRRLGGQIYFGLRFSIQSGLRYADDVCFAGGVGREIQIDDIILNLKRAADSSLAAFAKPYLVGHVPGMAELSERLDRAYEERERMEVFPDFAADPVWREYQKPVEGLQRIDDYTIEVLYFEPNPQAVYLFSSVTGSPVPIECLAYYNGREGRPTYDRHPISSGAFMLREWNPGSEIVLVRNPNYRNDYYPNDGEAEDAGRGLLAAAGKRVPFLDEVRIQLIARGPPRWSLFGQGYLDIYSNQTDLKDRLLESPDLLERYQSRGVVRNSDTEFATFGWSLNLNDPLFRNNRLLRQAISLAIDRSEMIRLFLPGRGTIAHSPIPPGMDGFEADFVNPFSVSDPDRARQLLERAGYPGGIDPETGRPLRLHFYDRAGEGRAAIQRFYINQFARVGLELEIEPVDFPTLIQKKNTKDFQMIHWGWGADYPDAQNFLQLFYGPNTETTYNESSYRNPTFDALYEEMRRMDRGPARDQIIEQLKALLARDLPVVYLYHRQSTVFAQPWVRSLKPMPTHSNELRYIDIDPGERLRQTRQWNRVPPATLLFGLAIAALFVLLGLFGLRYRLRGAGG